ncbi:hypothetical protein ADP65_00022 [Achromobacter phage phiAxp-3]|uniref:Uncharacterized protein n=1 Tax=Achromobacter phage phiAxp-3 TaxID=1664247 RepID=A0A0K2FHP8_9CAUD|nr:hypothetical protein ADP65_00022 [Achromobacter phage phiAxp-3]ALA45491.1 hypothetical protein ADP65_00022 [Achromobacter phage phiAxp-3]
MKQPDQWVLDYIHQELCRLIQTAQQAGVVCRVDLVPTKPLRMGGYTMVTDVRPTRQMEEPITEYERLEMRHMGNAHLGTGIYSERPNS